MIKIAMPYLEKSTICSRIVYKKNCYFTPTWIQLDFFLYMLKFIHVDLMNGALLLDPIFYVYSFTDLKFMESEMNYKMSEIHTKNE